MQISLTMELEIPDDAQQLQVEKLAPGIVTYLENGWRWWNPSIKINEACIVASK